MKMHDQITEVTTDGVGEVKRASINANGKMFNFLSKQIYSDIYPTILRELVANAIDGQKVNGNKTRPIVSLPSILEPHCSIRDFGCGMSHDFMMNNFMAFGDASTKDQSDDFIGGFGLGSKSPLGYTEQYSVKNFINGTLRIYSVFKDESGCPAIAFLAEQETTEPDGVEVTFPVRQDDIHKFTDVAIDTLQYFDPLPELTNTELVLEPIKYDAKGNRWGMRVDQDKKPRIIIGGVSYPLNVNQLPYDAKYQTLRDYAHFALDLYLDIGEANIALSREQVTHDTDLFDKLSAITADIGPEFGKQLSKMFEECDSLWLAKQKLDAALSNTPGNTPYGRILQQHATYKGVSFTRQVGRPDLGGPSIGTISNPQPPAPYPLHYILHGDFNWNHSLRQMVSTLAESPKFRAWDPSGSFSTKSIDAIIIEDTTDKPILRLRAFLEKNPGKRVLVLRDASEKRDLDMKKVLEGLGNPPASMIFYASKFDPIKLVRSGNGMTTPRPFKCYTARPYRGSSYETALPTGGGIYVVMDNFYPLDDDGLEIARLSNPKNVVWLNKTDFEASGIDKMKNWMTVEDGKKLALEQYKKKHGDLAMAQAFHVWWSSHSNQLKGWLEKLAKNKSFPKRGALAKLNALRILFEPVSTTGHSQIRKLLIGEKYEGKLKQIIALHKEAQNKHPHLFELIGSNHMYRASDAFIGNQF